MAHLLKTGLRPSRVERGRNICEYKKAGIDVCVFLFSLYTPAWEKVDASRYEICRKFKENAAAIVITEILTSFHGSFLQAQELLNAV